MLGAAVLLPLSPMIYAAPTLWTCLALVMVIALAHQAWLTNLSALVVDTVPRPLVATAFGVVACGSTLGGMIMSKVVGYLVTYYSYRPWFTAMAFLHPVARRRMGGPAHDAIARGSGHGGSPAGAGGRCGLSAGDVEFSVPAGVRRDDKLSGERAVAGDGEAARRPRGRT